MPHCSVYLYVISRLIFTNPSKGIKQPRKAKEGQESPGREAKKRSERASVCACDWLFWTTCHQNVCTAFPVLESIQRCRAGSSSRSSCTAASGLILLTIAWLLRITTVPPPITLSIRTPYGYMDTKYIAGRVLILQHWAWGESLTEDPARVGNTILLDTTVLQY